MFKFKEITTKDIPAMLNLLHYRQSNEIKHYKCLNIDADNKVFLRNVLIDLLNEESIGIGAFIQDELVGYIVGEVKNYKGKEKSIEVPYEGIAVLSAYSMNLIRELYAKISVLWKRNGFLKHKICVPLGQEEYLKAFMQLSFSIDQVYAGLKISDYQPFGIETDVNIRLIEQDDKKNLGEMSSIILDDYCESPTYLTITKEMRQRTKLAFENLINEDDIIMFIAEKNKETLAFQEYEFVKPSLMIPNSSIELCTAGTFPSYKNMGIGKTLMDYSVDYLKALGYEFIITDWKATSISASIFWPKCGFKPIAYRMSRVIE